MSELKFLREILEAAAAAPSPDNNQPWSFGIANDVIQVYLDPNRSLPSDELSMFDMTGIGAAVENTVLAAGKYGYQCDITWRGAINPPECNEQPVVEIELLEGGSPDPLFESIYDRCTCRKPYSSQPLESEALQELTLSVAEFPQFRVDFLTERKDKSRFGKLIAKTDSLRFRTRPFHEELFRQLRFTSEQVHSTRDGLDVQTLELPKPIVPMLKVLGNWSVMRTVNALRLTPLLTAASSSMVRKSGAIAIFSVPIASPNEFFVGGRAIQRFWLAATRSGLSVHPLGSIPIFLLQSEPRREFRPVIRKVRAELENLVPGLGNRVVQLALRLGHSDPPTVRSIRRSVDDCLRRS